MDILVEHKEIIEKDLQIIMGQLLLAVDYMHQMDVIHRDLKLSNILLNSKEKDNYDLRVADLGLAYMYTTDSKPQEKCGTPTYIGPEILEGDKYDHKVDIFSLGSIMYNLITGRYLFECSESENVLFLNKLCHLGHIDRHISSLSHDGRDLLLKLLEKNPLYRPTAKQALQHRWFQADREALDAALIINEQIQTQTYQRKYDIQSNQIDQQLDDQGSQMNVRQSFLPRLSELSAYVSRFSSNQRIKSRKESLHYSYYDIITSNRNAKSKSPHQFRQFTSLGQNGVYTPAINIKAINYGFENYAQEKLQFDIQKPSNLQVDQAYQEEVKEQPLLIHVSLDLQIDNFQDN
ncbi:serine threonine protein kinase [Stylonychia lemnae]|uniref:Serine threonine protein kinase n=1 Tax=Stylonychia lemnae TaxID=5949 RepID=A0A078A2C6_STYLE|nr:serine threonine protein kinase [Stylonychia lemnae]|eukprot:CDW74929.1 serine threonine protein kinase [Stylonychia lemnae]